MNGRDLTQSPAQSNYSVSIIIIVLDLLEPFLLQNISLHVSFLLKPWSAHPTEEHGAGSLVALHWLSCDSVSFTELSRPGEDVPPLLLGSVITAGLERSPSGLLTLYFFVFLGPHLQQIEVPRLEVKLKLQLLACTTAATMPDPSCICNLHHSSQQ